MLDRMERRFLSFDWLFPQTAMQELRPWMVLVITRPLETALFFEARVAHAGVVGAQMTQLIPHLFSRGMSPLVAELTSQVANNCDVIARLTRRAQRLPHALHAPLTVGDRSFRFAPTRCGWQDHVSHL